MFSASLLNNKTRQAIWGTIDWQLELASLFRGPRLAFLYTTAEWVVGQPAVCPFRRIHSFGPVSDVAPQLDRESRDRSKTMNILTQDLHNT